MHRVRGRLTYSNIISTLCLVLLLGGGTAYAASQLGKGSVGTKQLKKAAVTPAKLSPAAKATLTGPQGPKGDIGARGEKGDKGEKGEAGLSATALWAVVEENGTIESSSPAVTGVSHVTPGSYVVEFNREISSCAYEVTDAFQRVNVWAAPEGGSTEEVFVGTEDGSTEHMADTTFYLAVFC